MKLLQRFRDDLTLSNEKAWIAVVAVTLLAFLVSAVFSSNTERLWVSVPLAVTLVWLTAIDLEKMRLPDVLTLPLIGFGLVFQTVADTSVTPTEALLGAVIGYASFRAIAFYFLTIRKKHGLGLGDVKLFAGLGAWAGAMALPIIALTAAFIGLLHAGADRFLFKSQDPRVKFGPALCLSFWIVWVWGTPFLNH